MSEISDNNNPSVLITGIEGFTGQYLADYLGQNGYTVYGISLFRDEQNSRVYQCDLSIRSEVEKVFNRIHPGFIIHLAGISFVQTEEIDRIYAVNVKGTENLLSVIAEGEELPEKVILASSAAVYGNQAAEILDESMCPQPNTHYGISKLAMEHMARNYFNKLNIVLVRPFNYTGPNQASHFVIPKIVDHFCRKERIIELGNTEVYREYNGIGYVADLYSQLLTIPAEGEIVNLCSGRTYALLDIIEKLQQITDHDIEVRINKKFVRKYEMRMLKGSTTRLESLLTTLPSNPPMDTILKDMLAARA